MLELDVNLLANLAALADTLAERWGCVDGVLHAIAYASPDAFGGRFLETPVESAVTAFTPSAYSLEALTSRARAAVRPRARREHRRPELRCPGAWPAYDWMSVAKAGLEAVARYVARELGPRRIRVNLVSAGPLGTTAASAIPGSELLGGGWGRQARSTDTSDPAPIAGCGLLPALDLSRPVTGEILHVDGGFHAIGAVAADVSSPSEPAAVPPFG